MPLAWKKNILTKVRFLLILVFSFFCGHFINESIRAYEGLTNKTESHWAGNIEDTCSLETKMLSLDEAEESLLKNLFKPVIIEFTICKGAIFSTTFIPEVYLGLNTPPPEQSNLFFS
ncbi:hypothetical protein [Emticicia sp. 17c]|uniref:hypothetical protein n=1 Tax=Emticicia sp. 17c TaxID=3127704 RepID=UPI00301D9648